ncbi:zinc finger, CCHC-type containing protein [Tanacetum coccineum]
MAGNTVKDMTMNFGKLDKFEGHDFRRWQKKMHFLLTMLKVVYVLTTPMPELLEDATVEAIRIREKWENDDYIFRGHILNGMSDSLFDVYTNVESAKELWDSLESKYMAEDSSSKKFLKDFKHTLKHGKDDLSLVQLGSHLHIEESLRAQDSDKGKGKEVGGPSVNMTEEGKNKHNKQNKGKKRSSKNNSGSSPNKKPKSECGKTGHFKRDCRSGNKKNVNAGGSGKGSKDHSQDQEDGFVLYMGDDHFTLVYGKGSVVLEFSSGKSITLFNVLYIPKLRKNLISGPVLNKCGYKQVYESDKYILSKCGVFVGFGYYNNGMFMLILNKVPDDSDSVYMSSSSTVVNSSLWHARLGHVHYKRMLEMSKDNLIPAIDENPDKSPYTPQQNGVAERKNKALQEMVNSMLSYSGLSEGLWGEAIAIVRLPDPKRKTLGEKGIDCIFVGYAEHSKAYRDDHSDDVPIEGSRDQVGSQYSYCYSIEEDPRTYDEAMQFRDAAFWKEAINDEIGSIMENNTWVLSDLPPGCKPLGCKWIFKRKMKVDCTIDKLLLDLAAIHNLVIHQMNVKTIFLNGDLDEEVYTKQPEGFVMPGNEHKVLNERYGEVDVILGIKIKCENKGIVITQSHYIEKILKKFNREDCSPVSTPMDPVKKLKPNTGKHVDQLEYSRAIGCLMYAMTSTRPDIVYDVGRLKAYSDASWINHVKDSSSTSGWVFLLRGGAISWAFKKQTCITGSTMEYEFVALAVTGARTKRATYVNIKFCRFKKLELGFLYIH